MADRFDAAGRLMVQPISLATKVVEKNCTQLGITAATEAQLIKFCKGARHYLNVKRKDKPVKRALLLKKLGEQVQGGFLEVIDDDGPDRQDERLEHYLY